ncbi:MULTISPECIES: SDR family NAD(P)-dependent oxidoreductase [Staphylococcus]|nr:SDR family NAD(P)-dependent oxidoreductase [Staphylococcus epidermidis]MCT1513183.1 SDR family NAD(P)-dependent oxidoreductase [Staphylococcus epidermidis]
MTLRNKVAIVTGASRGIGKAITTQLSQQGVTVIGVYNKSIQAANELENTLNKKEKLVTLVQGEVSDRNFVQQLVKNTIQEYGAIDFLINNAGINRDSISFKMSEKDWNDVIETNFIGTYNFCSETIPYMVNEKKGHVVNMSSVTGVVGREAQTNYAASKGAIIGLTKLFSRMYASYGININTIAPGMIKTEMLSSIPEQKLENFERYTSTKCLGTVEQVARAVILLISDENSYFNNTVFKLDGGFLR